ncbi:MAG: phosphoribosylformylglycinamidine synthase subunit PurL [Candidatus Eremiobacteraeota bacterium]|nr:phosphoribosylformylglycinamidine synthase subunit PurL [Candidatus Eremiobacteraeota bacterium]
MVELSLPEVALSSEERKRVIETLGREPTPVEWFAFDAQWSEHCSYKSSRRFLRNLPTTSERVVLGPGEDAGVLRLGEFKGDAYAVVVAHESHNHPSQVVPFEGAATGIGGIVRDVLCMGAEVIGVADPLRFGTSTQARYIAQGVVDGIAAYGNAIGVPNVGGDVAFDPRFDDNVLVNVVALGLVKERELIHSRAPKGSVGWDIVLVGKATDRSGFGGASFSSLQLDAEDAEANKGAVQVPDAFLKSVIMRASYRVFELLRREAIEAGFKDLGAGGVMGCTAELVASGGYGARIELDKVPVTDPELPPPVIAVGETQERLCWIVPPAFTPRLLAVYNEEFGLPRVARGAAATPIGKVLAEPRYLLAHRGTIVMDVPTEFLCGGIAYERPYELPPRHEGEALARDVDLRAVLPRVLAHLDVCSRAPIFERYDAVVRGTTAVPRGYADAGVLVPIPGSPLAVALGVAGNPRYGALDPYAAAVAAVVEAARNVAAVGARPVALTDCLNFGDADEPRQFGAFVAAVDGLAEAANALGTPFVSGNVSLYNTSAGGNAVPASPIVACVGTLDDVAQVVTPALQERGSALYLVGRRDDALGGSVFGAIAGAEGEALARCDPAAARAEIDLVLAAVAARIVLAAHDVSDGGVATAVCEMAFAARSRGLSARLAVHDAWAPETAGAGAWFGEAGGFVVEVADKERFRALAHERDVAVWRLGDAIESASIVFGDVELSLSELHEAWSSPLREFYA